MSMAAMSWVLGLAATLGPPDVVVSSPGVPIGCRLRVVEMRGTEWRGAMHDRLVPIARQGNATVWVAPASMADELANSANRVVMAPSPAPVGGAAAAIRQSQRRPYVADVKRVADGAYNQSHAVAYVPVIGYVDDAVAADVRCRRHDEGVLTSVTLASSQFEGLESVVVREQVKPDPAAPIKAQAATLNAQLQVPIVTQANLSGRWMIPHGHCLVVGLGARSQPGHHGETLERVALVTPMPEVVLADSAPPAPHARPASPAIPVDLAVRPTKLEPAAAPALPPRPMAEAGRWGTPNPQGVTIATPDSGTVVVVISKGGPVTIDPSGSIQIASAAPAAMPAAATLPPLPVEIAPEPAPSPVALVPPAAVSPALPEMPSRSLPPAYTPEGQLVEPVLPTAPAPEVDPSAEPRGTPQSPDVPSPTPSDSTPPPAAPATAAATSTHGIMWVKAVDGWSAASPSSGCPASAEARMTASSCPGGCPASACAPSHLAGVAAILGPLAAIDAPAPRDALVAPARAAAPPAEPRHTISLSLGLSNRLAVEPGRLPNTRVVRLPLGLHSFLNMEYRDDCTPGRPIVR